MIKKELVADLVVYFFLSIFLRILHGNSLGAFPIVPIATIMALKHGFEASLILGSGAFFISSVLIQQRYSVIGFDVFSIVELLYALGLIMVALFVALHVWPGMRASFFDSLLYQTIFITIFLEVGFGLTVGQIITGTVAFYHLFANLVLVWIIGIFREKG